MTLEQLQSFLMWCSIINLGLMTFSFVMIMAMRQMVCRLHAKLFSIPEASVMLAFYWFIGMWKIFTFALFVVPWLATYLVK